MDTSQTCSVTCAACGKAAALICTGCAGDKNITDFVPTPTWYCDKACQTAHWATHKKSCQAVHAKVKLFRAGVLLQQVFLATRAEAFDISLEHVMRSQDGKLHLFDQASQAGVRSLSSGVKNHPEVMNAVLSYCAGYDGLCGVTFELAKRAFSGK